ncbi:molybdopterin molybdotransferase MoeA [Shouchella shacheensis]|uniref:molybdopterin molybdotransferase MoeA n=1 Tax=Shouchella shacheensis TaxID=1649580 RepID=UPI00073FDA78|nr:gephyrin-like molybdotransferase Glp [Shouchella shacheensis]
MVEKRKPIRVAEAVSQVMAYAGDGQKEKISIQEAYGRVLGEDLIATHPVPPFDRSPYDGFAIRSKDSQEASKEKPTVFKVVETIGAGFVATQEVGAFEAVRIMTGAMLPSACDAVVMLESTEEFTEDTDHFMSIKHAYQPGDNVSFQGEDTEQGTVLVRKGERISPGVVAVLATFGYEEVVVAKKPLVGVLATGSELLAVGEELQPGKIRNSNAEMVGAQIERAGATAKHFGKLSDDLEECYELIKEAAQQVDILITTGGVSVGDYDFLPEVYQKLGAEVLFNKIAMRPGSVTTVAYWNDTFLYGLSGNPSACYVGFELLVRPVVQTRLFNETPHLQKVQARLGEDFLKPNPFTRFVRSKLSIRKEGLFVSPSGFNKSSAVTSLAATDVFMVLPGGTKEFRQGDSVDLLLLESNEGSEWPWAE